MAQSAVLERILHDFESVASQLPDSVVSREARQRAAAELTRLGWPSARDEQWRYANLRAFEQVAQFRSPAFLPAEIPSGSLNLPPPLPGFERLVFVDGRRNIVRTKPLATAATAALWPAQQRLGLLGDMFASDVAAFRIHGSAAIELLF